MKLILLLALHGGAHASTRHKATKNAVDEAKSEAARATSEAVTSAVKATRDELDRTCADAVARTQVLPP